MQIVASVAAVVDSDGCWFAPVEIIDAEFVVVADAVGQGAVEFWIESLWIERCGIRHYNCRARDRMRFSRDFRRASDARPVEGGLRFSKDDNLRYCLDDSPSCWRYGPRPSSEPQAFTWGLAVLAEADDLVEHALGDFPLGGFGDFDHFVVGDDGDGVAVGIEAHAFARDIVDHDGVERFRDQFLAGIFQDVFGFGGEADDDLRLLFAREFLQNVGRRLPVPASSGLCA